VITLVGATNNSSLRHVKIVLIEEITISELTIAVFNRANQANSA